MDFLRKYGFEAGKGRYYEEVLYSLALIYNIANNALSVYLKDFGLTPARFNVLMAIKHQGKKEGVSQVEISRSLIVTASNMTRLLDKLEKEGLIQRASQQGDRRVNFVLISEKGSKILDRAWPGYEKKLRDLIKDLPQGKQKSLAALLMEWFRKLE
ncbi:MAG: MarR family transcriptional regulator [Candidatus Omnitrophota bacterium]